MNVTCGFCEHHRLVVLRRRPNNGRRRCVIFVNALFLAKFFEVGKAVFYAVLVRDEDLVILVVFSILWLNQRNCSNAPDVKTD